MTEDALASHVAYGDFCVSSHTRLTPARARIAFSPAWEMSLPRSRALLVSSYDGYHQSEYPARPNANRLSRQSAASERSACARAVGVGEHAVKARLVEAGLHHERHELHARVGRGRDHARVDLADDDPVESIL